jgi:uncharacterized membrane protein YuzA (DUF378 family)
MNLYTIKTINMISLLFLVVGGIVLGLRGLFNIDILKNGTKYVGNIGIRVLLVCIAISTLLQLFSRDFYLPFLGDSAYPCGSLIEKVPEHADKEVLVYTPPNSSVIYWAAESNTQIQKTPWMAYSKNTNAGVTKSDEKGKTLLKVRNPASYKVPSGRTLKPHIHYRVCLGSGMLGRVQTVMLE